MKARFLRKLLNNTQYIIDHDEEYLFIGSHMCYKLLNVNKKTLELKYALDTFSEGRAALKNKELIFIYDKLKELINNGEIKNIIEGNDEIENPITIYTFNDEFEIIETYTDNILFETVYSNLTHDGYRMYKNTHFKTKKEAIEVAVKNCKSAIKNYESLKKEKEKDISTYNNNIEKYNEYINKLFFS